jgi:hypothetical protein
VVLYLFSFCKKREKKEKNRWVGMLVPKEQLVHEMESTETAAETISSHRRAPVPDLFVVVVVSNRRSRRVRGKSKQTLTPGGMPFQSKEV